MLVGNLYATETKGRSQNTPDATRCVPMAKFQRTAGEKVTKENNNKKKYS